LKLECFRGLEKARGGRAPRGARGLKHELKRAVRAKYEVAPREGRVD